MVGATRLRHNIDTPFLASEGGHIGYDVSPGGAEGATGIERYRRHLRKRRT